MDEEIEIIEVIDLPIECIEELIALNIDKRQIQMIASLGKPHDGITRMMKA